VLNLAHKVRDFWYCFHTAIAECQSALDVGCGNGANLRIANQHTRFVRRVGIEIYGPYIVPEHPANQGIEWIIGDALVVLPIIADKSFELVLLIDVVEHFSKDDGLCVLQHADRIASKLILLWAPEGDHIQDEHHYRDNPYMPYQQYQDHLSSWYRKELQDLGYDVAVWDNYHTDMRLPEGALPCVSAMFCLKTQEVGRVG